MDPKNKNFELQTTQVSLIGTHPTMMIVDDIGPDSSTSERRDAAWNWFKTSLKGMTMKKFAPVAPIRIYEALANRGYVPDNVLLLAHDVVKSENAIRYSQLFEHRWKDCHVIMDNSLIELGGSVDISMVQEAVDIVAADVVVLPDSLTDGIESADLTIREWDHFKTVFSPLNVELLAVVQGETQRGFFGALELLAKHINPDWISIPRRTESKFGYHRRELINFVDMFFPGKPIHLLGFSEYPWEDIAAAQDDRVKSIDSAAPLRSSMPFSDPGAPRVNKETGADWWDTCNFSYDMLTNINKVDKLIQG